MGMKIRTSEEIQKSMKEKNIITDSGTFTGTMPETTTAPATTAAVEIKVVKSKVNKVKKEKTEKTKPEKIKKTKTEKTKKITLNVEGINDFDVKNKMVVSELQKIFGERMSKIDENNYTVSYERAKTVSVNIKTQKMNIHSKSTKNTVGIVVYAVCNGCIYRGSGSIGEYAGQYRISNLLKMIDGAAELALSSK